MKGSQLSHFQLLSLALNYNDPFFYSHDFCWNDLRFEIRRLLDDVKKSDLTKNDSLICWRIQIVQIFLYVKSKEFNKL